MGWTLGPRKAEEGGLHGEERKMDLVFLIGMLGMSRAGVSVRGINEETKQAQDTRCLPLTRQTLQKRPP